MIGGTVILAWQLCVGFRLLFLLFVGVVENWALFSKNIVEPNKECEGGKGKEIKKNNWFINETGVSFESKNRL